MTTVLERVARAIFNADHPHDAADVLDAVWERPSNYDFKAKYTRIAIAALQALRQVDDETVEAMDRDNPVTWPWDYEASCDDRADTLRSAFTAAIDHILSQTPNQGSER